ncbi:MAG: glycosyltransferase [Bacteroidales bacterium]|nr:glycosyltransferase [Bacteroidales bacterium]
MQFIVNTITRWEEPPRARHQVAEALSKNNFVVFIAANKFGFFKVKTLLVHENLKVLTPYFPIINKLRYRLPIINEVYQYWLFTKLRKSYKDFKVINFDFTATKIFGYFNYVIYYCNDSFAAISRHINPFFISRYHRYCESKVATRAKFCIAVSTILKDNLLKFNPNSFEIPLGSPDIEQFKITINDLLYHDGDIQVGLVGFIKIYNISYQAINNLLRNEKIRITLIGPVEDKFINQIERKDKLILKGTLTGKELYEEINKFDVAIAPYCARLTEDVQSGVGTGSKIYHYFAMGKPVVISFMAGLSKVNMPDGFLYIAKSDEEFSTLINKALKENSKELIKQRINFARENSWVKRMEIFTDYVKMYEKS